METAIIIAIISSSLTVIITVVNILLSINQRKKADRLATVTIGRVKYLDKIRAANAEFAGRTEIHVIKYCAANPGDKQNYPVDISIAAANLKTFLKPFYKIEQTIITQIDKLLQVCLSQFVRPDNDFSNEITKLKTKYDKLYAQYDWSYWRYIQKQYDGRELNSDNDFDAVYKKTRSELGCSDYLWE